MKHERGIAGQQHHRAFAACRQRGPDRIGQTGPQMPEVLVPHHIARPRLRIGPGEDRDGAAIANHDPILGKGLRGLYHKARRVDRHTAPGRPVGAAGAMLRLRRDPAPQLRRERARRGGHGLDQLGHDIAQVAEQRNINGAVYAESQRVALEIDPLAGGIARLPVSALAEMDLLAQLRADRQHHV